MIELKLIEIKPNITECKILFNSILISDMGVSDGLKEKLLEWNKSVEELTKKDIEIIENELFWNDLKLYNLVNSEGKYILPFIYTSLNSNSNATDLFCFSKYGEEQSFDLFTKSGKKIYENAWILDLFHNNILLIQNQDLSEYLYKYYPEKEELLLITNLYDNSIRRGFNYSENRLFIENGYVDENLQPSTPFCFDNGKEFKEGLAAVSLNGKWGYINNKGKIVINFQYGAANSFHNGFAKVLKLKPEFISKKGFWVEVDSFNPNRKLNFNEHTFESKFPEFPKKIIKPLSFIRGNYKPTENLINEYNCFNEVTIDLDSNESKFNEYGTWIIIDINGNQINKDTNSTSFISTNNTVKTQLIAEKKKEEWIEKIKKNGSLVNILPDNLFVDKEFVLIIIKENPSCFIYLSCYYSDDVDVCSIAFQENPTISYPYFSERLKEAYLNDYNKLIKEEIDFFESIPSNENSKLNLEEDLPF